MKKFFKLLFTFLIPLLGAVILLFAIPVSKKYGYAFVVRGGCEGRSNWLYHKIFEDTGAIDVAFIGTSHFMCAVNDSLIEKAYNDSTGQHLHFCNLAYCGYGRNFHYVEVKDLLAHKKVKAIVLEVREAESQLGHGAFAVTASTYDLFNAPIAFNRSYFPDVYKALLMRLQYWREQITREDAKRQIDVPQQQYGFNGSDRVAGAQELDDHLHYLQKHSAGLKIQPIENGLNSYPLKYVAQIAALANANHVQLLFYYVPEYGHTMDTARLQQWYGSYGKVLYIDTAILENRHNWYDPGHLNIFGATPASQTLSKQLIESL